MAHPGRDPERGRDPNGPGRGQQPFVELSLSLALLSLIPLEGQKRRFADPDTRLARNLIVEDSMVFTRNY